MKCVEAQLVQSLGRVSRVELTEGSVCCVIGVLRRPLTLVSSSTTDRQTISHRSTGQSGLVG